MTQELTPREALEEINRLTRRLLEAEARAERLRTALRGLLDWYEQDNGADYCECDESVDLMCNACRARAELVTLPTAEQILERMAK